MQTAKHLQPIGDLLGFKGYYLALIVNYGFKIPDYISLQVDLFQSRRVHLEDLLE